MHQQTFSRATNSSAAGLSIQHHIQGFLAIGRGIYVDMHNAFQMRKHRHPSLALHQSHKPFAPARDNHINRIDHGEHFTHRRPITRRHQLYGRLGQSGRHHAFDHGLVNGSGRMKPFRSTAQNDSIASLQTQSPGIRSHIGAAFINHTDNAEGRTHALNMPPGGALPLFQHLPHRIFLLSHSPQPVHDAANAVFIQHQTVQHSRRKTFVASIFHIERIGGYNISPCDPNIFGRSNQGRIFPLSRSKPKLRRGRFCGDPDLI